MGTLPTGTVTFLFTDIEGSTKLARKHPDVWEAARARHHTILREAIESNNGFVFQIIGDAFCAAFHNAGDAFKAALKSQQVLHTEPWGEIPIRVRMGIHTGEAETYDNEYRGYLTLSLVQRMMSAGHGGQVLVSGATENLLRDQLPKGAALQDMGKHNFKDVPQVVRVYQLIAPDLQADFPALRTSDTLPNNLPAQLTSFVGREKEMADIVQIIKEHRLVTLTGVGGTGKTRLSLQISADLMEEFPDGVWFVKLAPIADASLVPQMIASIWNVHEQPGRPLMEVLVEYARTKQLLLVLDNCEHVVEACASLCDELIRNSTRLRILTTSRVPLHLAGEAMYPVHPLALPNPEQLLPLPALTQFEAIRLFIERAVTVRPTYNVTNANAHVVAQICQQLDGIPLAIELAAAWVRALSPDQISKRLENRFDLLTGGTRDALPRQQTLRATMDWSYELLSEDERMLLNQLSVFAGNFSLDAVESICNGGNEIKTNTLDLLTALVDNSLVNVEEELIESRYNLLETVRQYALEKLQASSGLQATLDRHLSFYVRLAEEGFPHVWAGQTEWMDRFEIEYDNLRTAMEHAISTNLESAIQLGKSLDMFWDLTHRMREGYTWAIRILKLTESWQPGKLRATALCFAGSRAGIAREYQSALELLEASLEMARKFGDKHDLNYSLYSLAATNWFMGNWERMRVYAEEYLKTAQELDDKQAIAGALWQLGAAACGSGDINLGRSFYEQALELGRKENDHPTTVFALRELAIIAHENGDYTQAKSYFREGVRTSKEARWPSQTVILLLRLGQIALHENDPVQAKVLFEESLIISQELNDTDAEADILAGFAGIAGVIGQHKLAAQLFGTAEAAYEMFDLKMDNLDHMTYDPIIVTAQKQLGETMFRIAWESGTQMSSDEAIKYALKVLQ